MGHSRRRVQRQDLVSRHQNAVPAGRVQKRTEGRDQQRTGFGEITERESRIELKVAR